MVQGLMQGAKVMSEICLVVRPPVAATVAEVGRAVFAWLCAPNVGADEGRVIFAWLRAPRSVASYGSSRPTSAVPKGRWFTGASFSALHWHLQDLLDQLWRLCRRLHRDPADRRHAHAERAAGALGAPEVEDLS